MDHIRRVALASVMAATQLLQVAAAQNQRDPTVPPASAGLAGAAGEVRAAAPEANPLSVIVRDGRPFVVSGTRLVGQGEKLGDARVERISETEIWLREGKSLRKIPRFAGVRRMPASVGAVPDCPPAPATAKKPAAKTLRPATSAPVSKDCTRLQP